MVKYPAAEHGIICRGFGGMYSYCGWPSVCKNGAGELIAVCSGFRLGHIGAFGKTVMFKSPDNAKTWSTPIIVNDTPLDDRDAGILCLGGEKLLVTWFVHPPEVYINNQNYWLAGSCPLEEYQISLAQISSWRALVGDESLYGSFIRLSDNNGLTWGETIKFPVSAPHGPNLLSDGTVLYLGKEMYSKEEEKGAIAAYKSADGGKTWTRLGGICFPEGTSPDNFHEPHVLELKNGRLLGMIRAQGDCIPGGFTIYSCYSDDRGLTWSVPKCLSVSGSPPHLLLHSSGAVICSFGRRREPFGERAIVSYDNGETWPDEYVIFNDAPSSDLGYPASVELPDGRLLSVYYQKYGKDSKASLLYSVWSL